MTLAPLLNASAPVIAHAFAATGAFGLGLWQLLAPKGTTRHRLVGYVWLSLMAIVAASSFLIHELRVIGPFSPIHLLSVLTLATIPMGLAAARAHDVRRHRRSMLILFGLALGVAGFFAFMPGRIMHKVLFGG
ncbi:DUF2306 domain-containing protein [Terrarubrum flagellatum]|uniref:DUF2306 domain-containing protein n=1 Tax=Terrirubrum flagellatum TaxID=2895980 RepID=UPI003144E2F5